jgi:Uma2 family endonuclease
MNAPHRLPNKISSAEFERMVRAGAFGSDRVELRDGWVRRMNAQYYPHGRVKREIADRLKAAIRAAKLGFLVDQETSVAFGDGFQPLPDIIVWDPGSLAQEPVGPIPGSAVCLVVEVADSTLGDDLGAKLEGYARFGLTEYWVADVVGRQVLLHDSPEQKFGTWAYQRRVPTAFGLRFQALTLPLTLNGKGLR